MTRLTAAVAAALLLAAWGSEGITLNPPPVLGSSYVYSYISGAPYAPDINDGTLSNATFHTFASGPVTSLHLMPSSSFYGKPRAVVDASSRLWFLDENYLRIINFAGDSVTTVFPPLGAPLNVLSCNGSNSAPFSCCGAISICGADAGWTTLYISAWTTPADSAHFNDAPPPQYGIIAVSLATWAYTVLPIPDHPWDCLVNATSPTSGTIYISVNGGIQTLNLATQVVSNFTQVLPVPDADQYSYAANTNFADGPLATAEFGPYTSLALGDGAQLYLADALNHCIRRLDIAALTVTTISGDPTAPPESVANLQLTPSLAPIPVASARWDMPTSVVWDSARQRLYVVCALVF